MTGLELLVLSGGAAGCCAGILALWVLVVERQKAILLRSLSHGFDVLEERRGNLDRPLGLLLRGREGTVDVEAVLRGEHPLWQLRQRDVWGPAWASAGRICVIDVDWREAVRELREMHPVMPLSSRYVVYADAPDAARVLLESGVGGSLATLLRSPIAATTFLVDTDASGRVQLFMELPRTGLDAAEAEAAIDRLRQLVRVVGGERGIATGAADIGQASPSGAPLAVPAPA